MILGITATRGRLSNRQEAGLWSAINDPSVNVVHHGDCVGGDTRAHDYACELGKNIVVHPPIAVAYKSFAHMACMECRWRTLRLDDQDYLERDRAIVEIVDELLALPATLTPTPRSGTWYTVNYAKKVGRKVNIIYP